MAEVVKIDDSGSQARVAFDLAKFLWYGAGKSDPKNTEEAKQFLGIVADCNYAVRGTARTDNTKL